VRGTVSIVEAVDTLEKRRTGFDPVFLIRFQRCQRFSGSLEVVRQARRAGVVRDRDVQITLLVRAVPLIRLEEVLQRSVSAEGVVLRDPERMPEAQSDPLGRGMLSEDETFPGPIPKMPE
jgi:hypothetical protein